MVSKNFVYLHRVQPKLLVLSFISKITLKARELDHSFPPIGAYGFAICLFSFLNVAIFQMVTFSLQHAFVLLEVICFCKTWFIVNFHYTLKMFAIFRIIMVFLFLNYYFEITRDSKVLRTLLVTLKGRLIFHLRIYWYVGFDFDF